MNLKIIETTKQVVELLVSGKYSELEKLTSGVRLNSEAIASAISDYGRKLILPPEEGYQLINVVEVENVKPKRWSIALPLWTQEEGRSDLTLEMTIIENHTGFSVELDDIHVL